MRPLICRADLLPDVNSHREFLGVDVATTGPSSAPWRTRVHAGEQPEPGGGSRRPSRNRRCRYPAPGDHLGGATEYAPPALYKPNHRRQKKEIPHRVSDGLPRLPLAVCRCADRGDDRRMRASRCMRACKVVMQASIVPVTRLTRPQLTPSAKLISREGFQCPCCKIPLA
jgi:hypothetical protein